jgi:hypothetical protein
MGPRPAAAEDRGASALGGAGTKQPAGRSGTVFTGGARPDPVSPASVAARVKRRTTPPPHPGGGWGTGAGDMAPGGADAGSAAAAMGSRTPAEDAWGDGMVNEEERGGAHDY